MGFELFAQQILFFDLFAQLFLLLMQRIFQLFDALFGLRYLLVAFIDLTVVFAFQLNEFFLGLKDTLLLDHFGFGFGLGHNRHDG